MSTDSELREAALVIRDKPSISNRYDIAAKKLAEHYLAQRADDGELVTEEWLRSLGAEALHADDPFYGWADDVGWVLAWHEPDNTLSIYGETVLHEQNITKRNVRQLLSALGVQSGGDAG